MFVFNENSEVVELALRDNPIEHIWVLDLKMDDWTLEKLSVIEEYVSPTLTLLIGSVTMQVPASWVMLICAPDTMQLDTVDLAYASGKQFDALVGGFNIHAPQHTPIRVVDYSPAETIIAPSIKKHQMMCLPISRSEWINVCPHDSFNKNIKGKVAGDLL